MNDLATRKQLLLAESALNRAQLVEDLTALTGEVQAMTERAVAIGTLTTSAVVLVEGLVGLATKARTQPKESETGPSWFQTALTGTSLLSQVWRWWQSTRKEKTDSGS